MRLHNVPLCAGLLPRNSCVAARCLIHVLWRIRMYLLALLLSKVRKACDDGNPVQIIRDDGAVSGTVLPPEERVEDAPTTRAVLKGRAKLLSH